MINFLKEMGIQQWRRRSPTECVVSASSDAIENVSESNDLTATTQTETTNSFSEQTYETTQATLSVSTSVTDEFGLGQNEQNNYQGSFTESKHSGSLKQALDQPIEEGKEPGTAASPQLRESTSEVESDKPDGALEDTPEDKENKKTKPLILTGLIDEEVNEPEVPVHIPDTGLINENLISSADQLIGDKGNLPLLESSDVSWESLEALIQTNEHCPSCGWGNAFLGSGDRKADWMFVADAPNKIETQEKTFFTGRSGQLFEGMLLALGLERSHVYTTSVFKCAPTEDLTLTPQCNAILAQQIGLLAPKVIVVFGEFAAQAVMKSNHSLNNLREQDNVFLVNQAQNGSIPVIPTFTPAQMLDDNSLKAMVWSDLKKSLRLLRQ